MSYWVKYPKRKAGKIFNFASAYNYEHYGDRDNQRDLHKAWKDNVICKVGEVVTYYKLSRIGSCTEPDFNIYDKNKKNWGRDLILDDRYKILCKSCLPYKRDRISWVVQRADKLFHGDPTDKIVSCSTIPPDFMNLNVEYARIEVQFYWLEDVQGLLEEMELDHVKATKQALYRRTIELEGVPEIDIKDLASE